jgi:RNA polymerase sigma-70 factor (ECF subfamily)
MSHSEVQPAIDKLIESRMQFLSFLRNRVRHAEDAEELLQDAFLKSLEKSSEVRDKEKIVAWFYRMLRNSVVDYYRKAGKNTQELAGLLADLDKHAIVATGHQNEICHCLHPLLENIKPEYRQAYHN